MMKNKKKILVIIFIFTIVLIVFSRSFILYSFYEDVTEVNNNIYKVSNKYDCKRIIFRGVISTIKHMYDDRPYPTYFKANINDKLLYRNSGMGKRIFVINGKIYLFYTTNYTEETGQQTKIIIFSEENYKILDEITIPFFTQKDLIIYDDYNRQFIIGSDSRAVMLCFIPLNINHYDKITVFEEGYISGLFSIDGKLYFAGLCKKQNGKRCKHGYDLFSYNNYNKELKSLNFFSAFNDLSYIPNVYMYIFDKNFISVVYTHANHDLNIFLIYKDEEVLDELEFKSVNYYNYYSNYVLCISDGIVYKVVFEENELISEKMAEINPTIEVEDILLKNSYIEIYGYRKIFLPFIEIKWKKRINILKL
ncbi:MAG: hypothetical protein PQJ46_13135 [Spirochaetales bacterium]|nr:hypothetical protein [Spirochaetales bacterium]